MSGERVHCELFDPDAPSAMPHIDLARWCDAVLVAPASAHLLAKLAHGLADDLLSTLCLAATVPIVVAPAMNREMWLAPSTQANRAILLERGVRFLGPGEGEQACGETGPGRMLDVPEVLEGLRAVFEPAWLAGVRVLVTAGPTREAIDPVGERLLPRAPKTRLARQLVPIIAERFRAKGQAQGPGPTSRA